MKETDHLMVLKALTELPFSVGRKLLIDILRGEEDNPSIINNRLDMLPSFGTMSYSEEELEDMVDSLLREGYMEYTSIPQNRYWKVLRITSKGTTELRDPTRQNGNNKIPKHIKDNITEITEKDKELFQAFDFFLSKYNEEQKKAITSQSEKIICIAGAGSGKTSVLTKRIEFLIKFRSTQASKILAITFTRKAKQEMIHRLEKEGIHEVRIETFNSFCEKILNLHEKKIYGKPVKVMAYKDKIIAVKKALHELGIAPDYALRTYFSDAQMRIKTNDQLLLTFINDCFMVLDYIKSKGRSIKDINNENVEPRNKETAELLEKICTHVDTQMKEHGLRDYMDQLMDAIKFFRENKEFIPQFEHILIDEYQDVNTIQIELLDLLNGKNIFAVGDPRQAIFGWRGSDIHFILEFRNKYPDSELITLTKNYRSTQPIVTLMNLAIKKMNLPDLESVNEGRQDIRLLNFETESAEQEFIIQRILHSDLPREDIFVLARTNRQLNEIAEGFSANNIKHILKNDEINRGIEAKSGEVTLATVHAIKGLEAKMVFVAGCTSLNFPCRASDHPATEIIKIEEYDKEEEERRLFYVAISRAKDSLYLTHTGKSPTYFLSEEMKKFLSSRPNQGHKGNNHLLLDMLKEWRFQESKKEGVPPYIIMKDETLHDLLNQKPSTLRELEEIKGLGPSRIKRFGKDILAILDRK